MSEKSKKSSANQAIDRPFDRAILKRAKRIAEHYRVILEADDDAGFVGYALELPNCFGDGKTPNACVANVREALMSVVACMLENDQSPPLPASDQKRTAQINVRVSEEEKLRLEGAARRNGFRGVSDFVRTTTLSHVDD